MSTEKTTRCPSCRDVFPGAPPIICPSCQLGITENSGSVPSEPYTPRFGFTGKELMDRRRMPLDEYVRRLKHALGE